MEPAEDPEDPIQAVLAALAVSARRANLARSAVLADALEAVARGRTNGEIARESSLAGSTVKTHIAGLMAKIGARNRVEAAMRPYGTGRVGGTPR